MILNTFILNTRVYKSIIINRNDVGVHLYFERDHVCYVWISYDIFVQTLVFKKDVIRYTQRR